MTAIVVWLLILFAMLGMVLRFAPVLIVAVVRIVCAFAILLAKAFGMIAGSAVFGVWWLIDRKAAHASLDQTKRWTQS